MGSVVAAMEGYRDQYLGYIVKLTEGEETQVAGRLEEVFSDGGDICFRLQSGIVFTLGADTVVEKMPGERVVADEGPLGAETGIYDVVATSPVYGNRMSDLTTRRTRAGG